MPHGSAPEPMPPYQDLTFGRVVDARLTEGPAYRFTGKRRALRFR